MNKIIEKVFDTKILEITSIILVILLILSSIYTLTSFVNSENYNNHLYQNNILGYGSIITPNIHPTYNLASPVLELNWSIPGYLPKNGSIPLKQRVYSYQAIVVGYFNCTAPAIKYPYQVFVPDSNETLILEYIEVGFFFAVFYKQSLIDSKAVFFNFTDGWSTVHGENYVIQMNSFKFNSSDFSIYRPGNYPYRLFYVGYKFDIVIATKKSYNSSLTLSDIYGSSIGVQWKNYHIFFATFTNHTDELPNLAVFYSVTYNFILNLLAGDGVLFLLVIIVIYLLIKKVRRPPQNSNNQSDKLYPNYKG